MLFIRLQGRFNFGQNCYSFVNRFDNLTLSNKILEQNNSTLQCRVNINTHCHYHYDNFFLFK